MTSDPLSTRAARLLEEAEQVSATLGDDYWTRSGLWAKTARIALAELTAAEAERDVWKADCSGYLRKWREAEAERDSLAELSALRTRLRAMEEGQNYQSGMNTTTPPTVCPACCAEDVRLRLCHVHAAQIPTDGGNAQT